MFCFALWEGLADADSDDGKRAPLDGARAERGERPLHGDRLALRAGRLHRGLTPHLGHHAPIPHGVGTNGP